MNGINPSNFITQFVPWVEGANEVGPKARTYTLLIQADQTGVSEALQGEFLPPTFVSTLVSLSLSLQVFKLMALSPTQEHKFSPREDWRTFA